MALRALQCRMHAGQRVIRILRVIEGDVCPVCRTVTGFAGRRECGRGVIGIRCAFEVGLMTPIAGRRQCLVVIVRMALCARHSRVGSRERKDCCVVERRRCPVRCCVAERAIRREPGCCVRGILGAVEVCLMTRVAVRRGRRVVVACMALRTLDGRVRSG